MTSPRTGAGVAAHCGWPSRAARQAWANPSGVARWISATSFSRSEGLRASITSAVWAASRLPLITLVTVAVASRAVMALLAIELGKVRRGCGDTTAARYWVGAEALP